MSKKQDIYSNDESIKRDSPLLHSITKENPFTVPENYFDNLPSTIIERCREEVISHRLLVVRERVISFVLGYKWRLLVGTGCIAVLCFFAIRMNDRAVSYEAIAQNIPDSLIVAHLDNNIASINEATLEDFSEGIPLGQVSENVKSESDSATNDQDIIAYLVDNNISVTEISNEP